MHRFHPAIVLRIYDRPLLRKTRMIVRKDVILLKPGFDNPGMGHPIVVQVNIGRRTGFTLFITEILT
jgi:hypothetical protein